MASALPCNAAGNRAMTYNKATCCSGEGESWSSSIGKNLPNHHHPRHLQVVLVSPQIPGNTGAVARTCAAALAGLHLVRPFGFSIDDTKLKRAGLDYWPYVVVKVHESWPQFLEYFSLQQAEDRLIGFSKKAQRSYSDVSYRPGDWLVFGSETEGLPAQVLDNCSTGPHAGGTARIPINETYVRSLNLSVAVGIGMYEALRQLQLHHGVSLHDGPVHQGTSHPEDSFA